MFVTILILLASKKALGDSCPVLNVTLQNLFTNKYNFNAMMYQFKEVAPVVVSPFYGIGDNDSFMHFSGKWVEVTCHYFGEQNTVSPIDITLLKLNRIYLEENLNDNRIQLNYSGNTDDVFCGAVAKMTEIWLVDYLPCFISFYGCQMAKVNGELKKFEGVAILFNKFLMHQNKCSYDDLHYTYDVLQNQAGVTLSSLTNITAENYKLARRFCQIERDQMNMCKNFEIDNFAKYVNLIFFVILIVELAILFVCFLFQKFVGFNYFL